VTGIRGVWGEFIGDIRGRAVWVVLGCLVCQMGLGFGYVFSSLAADILAEFGWTRVMYESARAPQIFVIAFASPLVGALAFRFGARRVLAAGTVTLGVGFLLVSLMQALWHMYGLVVLLGLAVVALGDISVGQIVTRWIDRSRGLALGIVYTGSNLGGWLLVPLATEIAIQGSWRDSFAWLGAGALIVMLPIALFVVREPRERHAPEFAIDRAPSGDHADDLNLAAALRTRSFWIPLRRDLRLLDRGSRRRLPADHRGLFRRASPRADLRSLDVGAAARRRSRTHLRRRRPRSSRQLRRRFCDLRRFECAGLRGAPLRSPRAPSSSSGSPRSRPRRAIVEARRARSFADSTRRL